MGHGDKQQTEAKNGVKKEKLPVDTLPGAAAIQPGAQRHANARNGGGDADLAAGGQPELTEHLTYLQRLEKVEDRAGERNQTDRRHFAPWKSDRLLVSDAVRATAGRRLSGEQAQADKDRDRQRIQVDRAIPAQGAQQASAQHDQRRQYRTDAALHRQPFAARLTGKVVANQRIGGGKNKGVGNTHHQPRQQNGIQIVEHHRQQAKPCVQSGGSNQQAATAQAIAYHPRQRSQQRHARRRYGDDHRHQQLGVRLRGKMTEQERHHRQHGQGPHDRQQCRQHQ